MVEFKAMDWLEPERSGINEGSVWFDIVIAADVVYYEEQEPLVCALRYCLNRKELLLFWHTGNGQICRGST